jgi:hypothetical protein
MPNHKTHCAISKKRTGYDFSELHNWIDGPSKNLGPNLRTVRLAWKDTDRKTIHRYWGEKKGKGWGDKAVIELLFHISIDNLSTALKWSKITYGENRYNYFELGLAESGYMYLDFDTMADRDLKETFSQDDFIFDDSDESLFDLDLTSVVKDVKKFVKCFSKSMEDFFK